MSVTLYNGQSSNVTKIGSWSTWSTYESYTSNDHSDTWGYWTLTTTVGHSCAIGVGWVESAGRTTTVRVTIDDGSTTLFTTIIDMTQDCATYAAANGYTTTFYSAISPDLDHDVVNFYSGTAATTTYRVWIWREAGGGGGNQTVMDALAFTDTAPSGTTVDPGTATESFTGSSVALKLAIPPATVTESFTGASVFLKKAVPPATVTETFTGQTPALKLSFKPATVTESFTGASVKLKYAVKPATVTETFVGQTPGLSITSVGAYSPQTVAESLVGASPHLKLAMKPATVAELFAPASPVIVSRKTIAPSATTESFTGSAVALKTSYKTTPCLETLSGLVSYLKLAIPPSTRSEVFTMMTPVIHVGATIPTLVLSSEIVSVIIEDDTDPFGIDPWRTEYLP